MATDFNSYNVEGMGLTSDSGYGRSSAIPQFGYESSTKKFDSSMYKVDGLSYPQDLDTNDKYGKHKVVFYINVSVDSKVLKNGENTLATVENVQRDMRGTFIGEQVGKTKTETAATVASAAATVAVAGGALGGMLGAGGTVGKLGGLLTGATGTLIATSTNNQEVTAAEPRAPTFSRPQKRLRAAIALYIPNNLQIRYSVGWGEEEMMGLSAFGQLGKGADELVRAMSGENKLNIGAAGGVAASVLTNLGIKNAPLGSQMATAAGIAANPKKEQSFKDVDFRTFTMDYQFSPRDSKEAQNILDIIRTFKYHMHPEFQRDDAFIYIYPSEFDVVYYKNNQENLNIHRHTSCVLTEMNVNYSPNGVFSTFPDGMPTNISVSLTFRELQLLTKETIEKYT